jgi:2C-methyl-D-erythritol 2,4-cyclodiphosphate synthase
LLNLQPHEYDDIARLIHAEMDHVVEITEHTQKATGEIVIDDVYIGRVEGQRLRELVEKIDAVLCQHFEREAEKVNVKVFEALKLRESAAIRN